MKLPTRLTVIPALLSLAAIPFSGCEQKTAEGYKAPRTGYVRFANFSGRKLELMVQGQAFGGGIPDGMSTTFYKKRAGRLEVSIDGKAGTVDVPTDEASSIFLVADASGVRQIAIMGDARKSDEPESATVRLVNLAGAEVTAGVQAGSNPSADMKAAAGQGSGKEAVPAGNLKVTASVNGTKLEASKALAAGKAYSIVIFPGPDGKPKLAIADNNPDQQMGMMQDQGAG